MKRFISNTLRRLSPRTFDNLRFLSTLDTNDDGVLAQLVRYEEEVRLLRAELNELRRDNRRVVELYDLVFNRMRDDNPFKEG